MRELTTKEILTISAGNADSGYEGQGCASQVASDAKRGALAGGYAGAIVGGPRGLPGGPAGIAAGANMALFVVLLSKVFAHTLVTVEIITIAMTH
ncbi:TPA: hypothetical protein ACG0BA_001154 [Serratia odorifera]